MTQTREEIEAWVSINQANIDDGIYPGPGYILSQMKTALNTIRQLLKETAPVKVNEGEKAMDFEKLERLYGKEYADAFSKRPEFLIKVLSKNLKDCPFCKGDAEILIGTDSDGRVTYSHSFSRCKRCGARTDNFDHHNHPEHKCIQMAFDAWNARAALPKETGWVRIKTMDDLPKKPGKSGYEQIDCLIFHKGSIKQRVRNCEHMVWDNESGDDFYCKALEPSYYLIIPQPPKGD